MDSASTVYATERRRSNGDSGLGTRGEAARRFLWVKVSTRPRRQVHSASSDSRFPNDAIFLGWTGEWAKVRRLRGETIVVLETDGCFTPSAAAARGYVGLGSGGGVYDNKRSRRQRARFTRPRRRQQPARLGVSWQGPRCDVPGMCGRSSRELPAWARPVYGLLSSMGCHVTAPTPRASAKAGVRERTNERQLSILASATMAR